MCHSMCSYESVCFHVTSLLCRILLDDSCGCPHSSFANILGSGRGSCSLHSCMHLFVNTCLISTGHMPQSGAAGLRGMHRFKLGGCHLQTAFQSGCANLHSGGEAYHWGGGNDVHAGSWRPSVPQPHSLSPHSATDAQTHHTSCGTLFLVC